MTWDGWPGELQDAAGQWADYQAGDVTIHSPHVVHASLDTTTDRMRLSADLRFLRRGEPAGHPLVAGLGRRRRELISGLTR